MAQTREEPGAVQQLELTAKSLRMSGDGSGIHLGMVVSFTLVAALPFVLTRFAGSGILALAVVLATLVLIAFVVDRVTPRRGRRRGRGPFRSDDRSAKIPASGVRPAIAADPSSPSATRTRNACRKAS